MRGSLARLSGVAAGLATLAFAVLTFFVADPHRAPDGRPASPIADVEAWWLMISISLAALGATLLYGAALGRGWMSASARFSAIWLGAYALVWFVASDGPPVPAETWLLAGVAALAGGASGLAR